MKTIGAPEEPAMNPDPRSDSSTPAVGASRVPLTACAWADQLYLCDLGTTRGTTKRGRSLNGEIGGFFTLGNLIDERMAKSQLPALLGTVEAGNRVTFGPSSADKTGIYCQGHAIPWLRLLSLSFGLDYKDANWRKRIRKGPFLRVNHEIQIRIGEMRNYRLFEMLVLHHQPACPVQPLAC
jgi:hypothetical protein